MLRTFRPVTILRPPGSRVEEAPHVANLQQLAEITVRRALKSGSVHPNSVSAEEIRFFALALWRFWLPFSMAWVVPQLTSVSCWSRR
jgi:hypothetical protein